MTKEEYDDKREQWYNKALVINETGHGKFTRSVKARLREVAKLDSEYKGISYDEAFKALLDEFGIKK